MPKSARHRNVEAYIRSVQENYPCLTVELASQVNFVAVDDETGEFSSDLSDKGNNTFNVVLLFMSPSVARRLRFLQLLSVMLHDYHPFLQTPVTSMLWSGIDATAANLSLNLGLS